MKQLLTLMSLTVAIIAATPKAEAFDFDLDQLRGALTGAVIEEIQNIQRPFYCITKDQGFGPYEGVGRTKLAAKKMALKQCGIFCNSDQRVSCEKKGSPITQSNNERNVNKLRAKIRKLKRTLVKKNQEINYLRDELDYYSDNRECAVKLNKMTAKNKDLTKRNLNLKKNLRKTKTKLNQCLNPQTDFDYIQACSQTISDQYYLNQCIKMKPTVELVMACSSINDGYYRNGCIKSRKTPAKISACLNAYSDNYYRLSCIKN